MLANLIFLIAVLFSLAFLGVLWLRQSLFQILNHLTQHEAILRTDMRKRRDMVPLVLEGLRDQAELSDSWMKLVRDRAVFHAPSSLAQEWEFEKNLKDFLASTNSRSLHFLEGKKDIEELSLLIEKEKATLHSYAVEYNEQRKRFPYSLASAIFGLRDIAVL